ncbi:hypothetical protein PAXINDRAFT_14309 [Paxillus involutus ATCC 200175]|uniref:F-box domain-containing protein n=1 Tax=Paxillus involutus ATCC 200175 TaxID=664439 RepID=A0A0C9U056_PAXIN|nr:hypothetical protein PAXINDRAFT_14309 [Paxillus involutus ATCC 200175]
MTALCGSYKNQATDPLNILPPELVEYMFYLWLLDGIYPCIKHSSSHLPVLLCLVSRTWRDFVYASPRLWAHVIFKTSHGAAPTLHVFQKQLERSQSAPLFVDIVPKEHPDRDALRMIFAESGRFRHLRLNLAQSRYDDIPTQGFTQLSKLTVHTGPQESTDVGTLRAIFSSAPHLRCVNWFCIGDPGPIKVNGRQLHFLDLCGALFPVTCVLEVLAACPNLRNAAITLQGKREYVPMQLMERILLPELRSLSLQGTKDLTGLLGSIQAPLLSHFDIAWLDQNGQEYGLEVLESFLAYSPHLEEIALSRFLKTENGLIDIIDNNKNLVSLTVASACRPWQTSFITHKTFQLLTRKEHGRCVLPHLEKLSFWEMLDITDEVVLRMIESRISPLDDKEFSSHSRRACTLKSISLCKPMAEGSIYRLQNICRESGLKAEGLFVDPSQALTFDLC